MNHSALHRTIGGHDLWIVPAVHFRAAFAEQVHRLCADRRTRPRAIAVELGAETAAAAMAWMRELGVTRDERVRVGLPCMLALTRPNRRIHASQRDMAVRLQNATGKKLHELPPELLKELLGYSAVTVFYLSPVDSIVEAIRCAIELGVPLYGVDLDEIADARRSDGMLEDPASADGRVERYANRNADYAATHRDDEVDGRRELAMAARLKSVLQQHDRVLFTGGLAHWRRLCQLLASAEVKAAPAREAAELAGVGFTRVIVHPLIAVRHMDAFPHIVAKYERHRGRTDDSLGVPDPLQPAQTIAAILQKAYDEYFHMEKPREQLDRLGEDYEAREHFEQFLGNLCTVKQQAVPDLFTVVEAAQGIMTPQFCRVLANVLMDFPWASPREFPEVPVLLPLPIQNDRFIRAELAAKDGRHGAYYLLDDPAKGIRIPWEWREGPVKVHDLPPTKVMEHSWHPTSYIYLGLSARALEVARREIADRRTEVFEGSLLEGVDIKPTIRAYIRGEDRILVHEQRRLRRDAAQDDEYPVVWIFRLGRLEGADWFVSASPHGHYGAHVRDQERLDRVSRERGPDLVEWIWFGTYHREPLLRTATGREGVHRLDVQGALLYYPCLNPAQTAAWVEETNYERNPITDVGKRIGFSENLRNLFENRTVRLDLHDWPVSLVRMAIPFAKAAVTVVAPDGFSLPPIVSEEARRRNVQICFAPLSYFPRELVRRMTQVYFAPVLAAGDEEFPEEIERFFGESQAAYRNLVPQRWQKYLAKARGV